MSELRVYPCHLQTVPSFTPGKHGFCNRGARTFCQQQGIDWADFVRNGIPASTLIATGDALALRVVAHAEAVSRG